MLCFAEQEAVEPEVFVLGRRPPQMQLRSEPPVEDPDRLFRILNDLGQRVEIVVTRGVPFAGRGRRRSGTATGGHGPRTGDAPLDVVAFCLACKRLEAVLLPNLQARLVLRFLVRFVVSVIRIQGVLSTRRSAPSLSLRDRLKALTETDSPKRSALVVCREELRSGRDVRGKAKGRDECSPASQTWRLACADWACCR